MLGPLYWGLSTKEDEDVMHDLGFRKRWILPVVMAPQISHDHEFCIHIYSSDFYINDYDRSELSEIDSNDQNLARIQNKLDIRQTSIDIETYIGAYLKGRRLGGSNTPTAMKLH